MTQQKSAMRGVDVILQNAASADEAPGLVIAIPSSFHYHELRIRGSSGVASGAVQPEMCGSNDYTGTWGQVGGGPITVVADTELVYAWEGSVTFLRCRISTAIGSGTGTVTYKGE